MSGSFVAVAVELLVAALLALTIGYCAVLNSRLKRLRADDASLRGTIAELVAATELAHRATSELKQTILNAERDLGETLARADQSRQTLQKLVDPTDRLTALRRPQTLTEAVRPMLQPQPAAPPPPAARPSQAASQPVARPAGGSFAARSAFSTTVR
jgi:hypothetical protein